MPEDSQNRIDFIDQLHDRFLMKKGHGAFAYISISTAITLFNNYTISEEPADIFINRFVRSI